MEAATQQDQIAQALRADSWGGRDGWKKRLAPNGAARPMSQFNEARKRLHARKEEQNEAESRECPAGVASYCNLFSTHPPRGAGSLNSGEHARPAEEEEGGSGDWRAGEPCWRWRPAIANFPKYRIRSARHDSHAAGSSFWRDAKTSTRDARAPRMWHRPLIALHRPGVGGLGVRDEVEERGFPRAVRPDQRGFFAGTALHGGALSEHAPP